MSALMEIHEVRRQLADALAEIDRLKAVPAGFVVVPAEVLDLYRFMATAFVPMTSQQDQIAISLQKAKAAIAGEKK